MDSTKPKKLPLYKWFLGIGALFAIIFFLLVVPSILFYMRSQNALEPEIESNTPGALIFSLILSVLFLLFAALGFGIYMILYKKSCFISNFNIPVYPKFRNSFFLWNLLVTTFACFALIALGDAIFFPILLLFGLPHQISFIFPVFILFPLSFFFMYWFNFWNPIWKRITRLRLVQKRVTEEQSAKGFYMGISNPEKSSWKKFGLIEDDIGMLWIEKDKISYVGDSIYFSFTREQLENIERISDAGSVAAYAGVSHIILKFMTPSGSRRIKLHMESYWTLTGLARATDELAEQIALWKASNP